MNRGMTYSIACVIAVIAMIIAMYSIHTPVIIENSALEMATPQPNAPLTAATVSHFRSQPQGVASTPPPRPLAPTPVTSVATAAPAPGTVQQETPPQRMLFGNGIPFQASDLPPSPLRTELEGLPAKPFAFAMTRLTKMSFHINDLDSLHVDQSGMPYYVCTFSNAAPSNVTQGFHPTVKTDANIPVDDTVSSTGYLEPTPSIPGILAAVSITNPPIRHSKPGATRILFLDFSGSVVTNTVWNTSYSVARWDCLPFDTDGTNSTFNDAEQVYIIQMWERVSEDYAPFNVDVTTEQPTNWTSTTGHALITPTIDANGTNCPHYGSGGIAYVNVFGDYNYSYNYTACYSPAFIKPMSGYSYASTAEAASHELGHNMGLSHDGYLVTPVTNEYYSGHGSGDISWGPIMGTAYGENVSQWSKGEYYGANQTQDDLFIISAKAPYRTDDHGHTNATASPLVASNGTIIISSGIITSNTDVDVFSFVSGIGSISMTVFPYRCASGNYGGNLDINARLYNSSGSLVASDNPSNATQAIITYTAPAEGCYYLSIANSGAGDPTNAVPSGYTSYGSIGQYFITGRVAVAASLIVQTPNGGELWYKGQTNSIIWSGGTNAAGGVKIELYRNGARYSTITNEITNSGAYVWTLATPMLSATNYQIRISNVTTTSIWDVSDAPFNIAAVPSTTLLYENFDASSSSPPGWSQTNLTGAISWKFQTGGQTGSSSHPATAYSSPYNACLYDETKSSDISRLLPPSINMTGCTGAVLRFRHYMEVWSPDQDYLNVWVKTNTTASWFRIAGYSNSIASWTQQTLPLPNPGTNYTIAFEGIAKYGFGVCLDDVEVAGYSEDITTVTNNIPLSWLADYGLDPTDIGALSDTDNDGMEAWKEWIAGTSPTQFSSVLKVSNTWNAANAHILNWSTVTGRTYSVTWTSNLVSAAFSALVTNNTTGIYTDAVHAVDLNSFYRIGVQMNP